MIKLPITEKAQEYGAKVKASSDARKQLDEGWQQHFDIEIEDAFRAGACYVMDEVNKPKTVEPSTMALTLYLAARDKLAELEKRPKNNICMTENQKMRLELYREFGEDAQKALDFIMAGDNKREVSNPAPVASGKTEVENGLYLIYEDDYKKYTGEVSESDAEGVKYIGIVHDGHSFAVTLKDLGKYALVQDTYKCPSEHPLYRRRKCDALLDWDCVERTKHIQEIGTDIPLADGEYIPSLPMLVLMCHYADKGLNDLLKSVGGEPFDMDECYWSVAESGSGIAWNVSFNNGYVSNGNKCYSGVVRPVAAFNI